MNRLFTAACHDLSTCLGQIAAILFSFC